MRVLFLIAAVATIVYLNLPSNPLNTMFTSPQEQADQEEGGLFDLRG